MQEQLQQILQQQLRDVHLPADIAWWPLATGWWVLIGLGALIVGALCYRLVKLKINNRYRKTALLELQNTYQSWQSTQDNGQYLQSANSILKRIVIHLSSTQQSAKLSGASWVNALQTYSKTSLSKAIEHALSEQVYQRSPAVDIHKLHHELSMWISSHNTQTNSDEAKHA